MSITMVDFNTNHAVELLQLTLFVIAFLAIFMIEILRRVLKYVISVDNAQKDLQGRVANLEGTVVNLSVPMAPTEEPDMSDLNAVLNEKGF